MLCSLAIEYDSFMTCLKFVEIFAYAPKTRHLQAFHDMPEAPL